MKDKNINNVCLYYLGGNMYKLLRFYNQNRKKLWFIVAIIVFVLIIIQLLNSVAKQQNEEKIRQTEINKNQETTLNNVVSYDKQSEAIISNDNVSKNVKNTNGQLLDKFFTYCVKHNPEAAYELLSTDIKNNMYQSEAIFESLYYQSKFEGNKQYSFQAWTTRGDSSNTYKVKIFDDILSTGKADSGYVEDYVTVIKEDDNYKLNINNYIGNVRINSAVAKVKQADSISMQVMNQYIYKDYQIFDIIIRNDSNNSILLDTREKTKGTYLVDDNGIRYEAILYENNINDLIIDAKQVKKIQIKFNVVNRDDLSVESINFDNIVLNYEQYKLKSEEKEVGNIEIGL